MDEIVYGAYAVVVDEEAVSTLQFQVDKIVACKVKIAVVALKLKDFGE